MSINKKSFLTSKFNNFINWIEKDKVLPKNNELFKILKTYSDFDKLLGFIINISNIADSEGNIPKETLSNFLSQFNISLSSFKEPVIDKFNRYLKCFIVAATYDN
jgi:hypothetical protein